MANQERRADRIEFLNHESSESEPLIDLSLSGVACYHSYPFEAGAIVQVRIDTLLVTARVVYCTERGKGFRLGLQFTDQVVEKQKQLNVLIDNFSRGVPVRYAIVDSRIVSKV